MEYKINIMSFNMNDYSKLEIVTLEKNLTKSLINHNEERNLILIFRLF